VADPEIFKGEKMYPSSFIAHAHNELYAFYTKRRLSEKIPTEWGLQISHHNHISTRVPGQSNSGPDYTPCV